MYHLASFVLLRGHVLLYITMTNHSISLIMSSERLSGPLDKHSSATVIAGHTFQASQAVFLPHQAKLDTVSQPAGAWNIDSDSDLCGPNAAILS